MRPTRRGTRRMIVVLAFSVASVVGVIAPAATAGASTSVSNVTVAVAAPSAAAGALTTYKVGFKTSASGGLDGDAGSTITIALPAGTGLTNMSNSSPVNVGATEVGYCTHLAATTATCYIYSGTTVAANTTVAITLYGVNNPTTASTTNTLHITTTSDTTSATSPTYPITAGKSLTSAAVSVSSSLPGATGVTYKVIVTAAPTAADAGATVAMHGTPAATTQ